MGRECWRCAVAVTAFSLAIESPDENVLSVEVQRQEGDGERSSSGPEKLFYYREGRRPKLPDNWMKEGCPFIPADVKPGMVDGVMRVTAVNIK